MSPRWIAAGGLRGRLLRGHSAGAETEGEDRVVYLAGRQTEWLVVE